ncbi:hypothetical protein [Hydrogenophaga laconesensis]|uniref:Uncharacterized protein n=1 Tax=Hydrogenophaga laconesensis TaxID=1805971 RepID=A0ABU1VB89_9BURK|nr:hypothetical protein [Hydrogenophaga laconesensis]MDR7094702.1 hypothetical protein [Hydrogenophaga laconesensis]
MKMGFRGTRRGRWVIVLLVAMLVLFGGVLALLAYVTGAGALGFMPPQMSAAHYTPKDVVGDLGGMPVTIARHIPHLVEYDGDPGWGEKRKGPPPERTHASRLKSFGVHVRYPDMATLSSPELWSEFEKKRLYDHKWLDLTIQSGSSYPGDGYLDRGYQATIPNPERHDSSSQYEPLPSPIKGLELYAKRGVNPRTGVAHRYEWTDGDLYIHRNREGNVTTFIRCTFRSGTEHYSSCAQDWSMEGHGLGIDLRARYAPDLLPQWQDIQARVSRFVLGFRDPQAASERSPTR